MHSQKSKKSDSIEKIYERLDTIEKKFGLTKERMAEIIGISLNSYYTARNKHRGFRLNSLFEMHRNLPNVDFNWLLFGEGRMEQQSSTTEVNDVEASYGEGDSPGRLSRIEKKLDQIFEYMKKKND